MRSAALRLLCTCHVELGGSANCGASITPMRRKATGYVDKIFSKEPDSEEFPVDQPVLFELVLNLKTGRRRSGLTVLNSLLGRADEVVE